MFSIVSIYSLRLDFFPHPMLVPANEHTPLVLICCFQCPKATLVETPLHAICQEIKELCVHILTEIKTTQCVNQNKIAMKCVFKKNLKPRCLGYF